jgi:hypothetical protein
MTALKWVAAAMLVVVAPGCVNQRKEIAKYRDLLSSPAERNVPQLEAGEELTLARAL